MKPQMPPRLHLGCGLETPSGWLNVDGSWQVLLARFPIIKHLLVGVGLLRRSQTANHWSREVLRLNLCKPLPFATETFEAVYCSHTLEHLYYRDAVALLRECHRVLKHGGICRFVVPDLETIVNRYVGSKAKGKRDAAMQMMEDLLVHEKQRKGGPLALYHRLFAFHQHKWMYDTDSLQLLFESAGFASVRPKGYLESQIDDIGTVENEGRILGGQGIAVEGTKP